MSDDSEVIPAILKVLEQAAKGKGRQPHYVTAYQILDRLPMRATLIEKYGKSGAGAGDWSSAAKHVAQLIQGMSGIDVESFDTRGVEFRIGDDNPRAGYEVCGLYRRSRA